MPLPILYREKSTEVHAVLQDTIYPNSVFKVSVSFSISFTYFKVKKSYHNECLEHLAKILFSPYFSTASRIFFLVRGHIILTSQKPNTGDIGTFICMSSRARLLAKHLCQNWNNTRERGCYWPGCQNLRKNYKISWYILVDLLLVAAFCSATIGSVTLVPADHVTT